MRKLIFLDLDGTIIDHVNHRIPKSTIEAIELARQNGHEVILATGRPPALMDTLLDSIPFDALVCANGRYVSYKGEVLRKKVVPRPLLDRFLSDMKHRGIDIAMLSTNEYFMRKEPTDYAVKFSDFYHLALPKHLEQPEYLDDVLQMVMFFDHDGNLDAFNQEYPELDFNISSPFTADVNTKDGLKEVGLHVFAEHLNMDLKDTVAIGDGHNDISMIEHAGIGVAMGNGCEPLKKAADYVTDTVDADGLYKAFKTLKLI